MEEELRRQVAHLAREYYAQKLTYKQFEEQFPDAAFEQDDTNELLHLIMHEPQVGGFFGVSKKTHEQCSVQRTTSDNRRRES